MTTPETEQEIISNVIVDIAIADSFLNNALEHALMSVQDQEVIDATLAHFVGLAVQHLVTLLERLKACSPADYRELSGSARRLGELSERFQRCQRTAPQHQQPKGTDAGSPSPEGTRRSDPRRSKDRRS